MSGLPPLVVSDVGPEPQAPLDLYNQLIALASTLATQGYTANLPGSLIDDIASTDVAALMLCDQARDDAINSVGPLIANAFVLAQLGQLFGIPLGVGSNTSVPVVFTGPANLVIGQGFVVSDGTYQYQTLEGTIISSLGISDQVTALATVSGSWNVPMNTVTEIITELAPEYQGLVSVNNPIAGTASTGPQSEWDYRAQVVGAFGASAQGMPAYVRTAVTRVPGVNPRLVTVRQQLANNLGQWEVIVGGGDIAAVANAIYSAIPDPNALTGSIMSIVGITQANPGQVTTSLNHGLTTGTVATLADVQGMTQVNNTPYTITVVDEKNFTIGIDTTSYTPYTEGGFVTPNPRNVVGTIIDDPDVYGIPFVIPPQQTVEVVFNWQTDLPNFTQGGAINQLGAPAIVDYINSIIVGAPINLNVMASTFAAAVSSIIYAANLTTEDISISINGVPTPSTSGTQAVYGDPESYFYATATSVTVSQGT